MYFVHLADKQEYAKRTQQELRLVSLEKDQGDLNESLKIEITGLHEAIKEAKHFIESEWRKITTVIINTLYSRQPF